MTKGQASGGGLPQSVGEIGDEHVVTLYAIYKKNGRAEAMNGNNHFQRKPKNRNVFLSEVDRKKASDLKSEEKSWRMLQSWV